MPSIVCPLVVRTLFAAPRPRQMDSLFREVCDRCSNFGEVLHKLAIIADKANG